MNFDTHPVDYPSLLVCGTFLFLNWLHHLTGSQLVSFAEGIAAVLGAILTVARFIDWLKKTFFNKKP